MQFSINHKVGYKRRLRKESFEYISDRYSGCVSRCVLSEVCSFMAVSTSALIEKPSVCHSSNTGPVQEMPLSSDTGGVSQLDNYVHIVEVWDMSSIPVPLTYLVLPPIVSDTDGMMPPPPSSSGHSSVGHSSGHSSRVVQAYENIDMCFTQGNSRHLAICRGKRVCRRVKFHDMGRWNVNNSIVHVYDLQYQRLVSTTFIPFPIHGMTFVPTKTSDLLLSLCNLDTGMYHLFDVTNRRLVEVDFSASDCKSSNVYSPLETFPLVSDMCNESFVRSIHSGESGFDIDMSSSFLSKNISCSEYHSFYGSRNNAFNKRVSESLILGDSHFIALHNDNFVENKLIAAKYELESGISASVRVLMAATLPNNSSRISGISTGCGGSKLLVGYSDGQCAVYDTATLGLLFDTGTIKFDKTSGCVFDYDSNPIITSFISSRVVEGLDAICIIYPKYEQSSQYYSSRLSNKMVLVELSHINLLTCQTHLDASAIEGVELLLQRATDLPRHGLKAVAINNLMSKNNSGGRVGSGDFYIKGVLVAVDRESNCLVQFRRRAVSDFGGPMYPPGFLLLNKVESYVETETELDFVTECDVTTNTMVRRSSSSGNIPTMSFSESDVDDDFLYVKRINNEDNKKEESFVLPLTIEMASLFKRFVSGEIRGKGKGHKPVAATGAHSSSANIVSSMPAVFDDPKKFLLVPPRKVATGETVKRLEIYSKSALAVVDKRVDPSVILHAITSSYNDLVRSKISRVRNIDKRDRKKEEVQRAQDREKFLKEVIIEIDYQCDDTEGYLFWSATLATIVEKCPDYNVDEHWKYYKSNKFRNMYYGSSYLMGKDKKKQQVKTKAPSIAISNLPSSMVAVPGSLVAIKVDPALEAPAVIPASYDGGDLKRKLGDE